MYYIVKGFLQISFEGRCEAEQICFELAAVRKRLINGIYSGSFSALNRSPWPCFDCNDDNRRVLLLPYYVKKATVYPPHPPTSLLPSTFSLWLLESRLRHPRGWESRVLPVSTRESIGYRLVRRFGV